jgi:hypothetical protein
MQATIVLLIVIASAAISISILASYIATITSFFPVRSWFHTRESILSPSPLSAPGHSELVQGHQTYFGILVDLLS